MLIDDMTYIEEHTPKPALYEQLAEEAVELAHAALKYARVLRGKARRRSRRYRPRSR